MKYQINKGIIPQEQQAAFLQKINEAEDKGAAILEVMGEITAIHHKALIDEILEEAAQAAKEGRPGKGMRRLSEEERGFYEFLRKGAKQAVTANQADILPVSIIDATMKDVKEASNITSLISFAPPGVKKWLTASKNGAAAWGGLTDGLTAELTATISAFPLDVCKLHAFCVIPKSIRDLELGYVDKYFRAVLQEAMEDGVAAGYLDGDGKTGPIGIFRKVDETNQDGTYKAKTVLATLTGFSPAQMAPVLQTLTHNGIRAVRGLTLVCNPLDKYQYVDPALMGDSVSGGYVRKAGVEFEIIEDVNCTQGKAAFTMPGYYGMGFSGVQVDEYKETKAMDDADLLVAKVYGNGRPADNDTAVIFDVTKLEPYVLTVKTVADAVADEG